jgi:hypothetical protein
MKSRTIVRALALAPLLLAAFWIGGSHAFAADTSVIGNNSSSNSTSVIGNNASANAGCSSGSGLTSPLKDCDLVSLLNDLLNFAITIGGIAIVLMLVFVGFKFVAAQGNPSKLADAQRMLFWTVVGALILLGAKAIEAGIQATVQSISS